MDSTLLEWLTKPNPIPDSAPCKDGFSTKAPTFFYGPHKVQPWADITWENLNATFGDILQQQTGTPRITDREEIDEKKLTIYEEDSVTSLLTEWTEKLVQHGLDGTRESLMAGPLKEHLKKGTIHFAKNTGIGHIPNEKGDMQKPDWCVWQEGHEKRGMKSFTYLVPGDSKPAAKWQSSWIGCDDGQDRRKADRVLQQLAKYMYLAQTQYGFVISEEELVPLRLSIFDRSPEAVDPGARDLHVEQIASSTGVDFETEEWSEHGLNLEPYQELADFLADADDKTGVLLEYCRIPWSNHGNGLLTINLTLWWLPILAVQNPSIDLKHDVRANNTTLDSQPVTTRNSSQRTRLQTLRRSKRKTQSSDRPTSKPKSRRYSRNHPTQEPSSPSQSRLSRSTRSTRANRSNDVVPGHSLRLSPLPEDKPSNYSKRNTKMEKMLMAESFTSVEFSSQATVEFNSQATDSFAVSFASSV
jgi:hypothetical protein